MGVFLLECDAQEYGGLVERGKPENAPLDSKGVSRKNRIFMFILDKSLFLFYSIPMLHTYRTPHSRVRPISSNPNVEVDPPPTLPPAQDRNREWLMAHIVDFIAAGPIYDGKPSAVWARMVELYGRELGMFARPNARPDARPDAQTGRPAAPPAKPDGRAAQVMEMLQQILATADREERELLRDEDPEDDPPEAADVNADSEPPADPLAAESPAAAPHRAPWTPPARRARSDRHRTPPPPAAAPVARFHPPDGKPPN